MSSVRHLGALVEARIRAGDIELPVFPSSAQEVLALCESSDVDSKQLANVIRRDASLAGHFLALANSAAFGARVPLVSLQQALARLGTTQTKQLALVVACKTRVFSIPGRPHRAAEILTHALGTALFAQEIARMRRLNVEEAFLTGLLHDVGRPAVLQLCSEIADAHSSDEHQDNDQKLEITTDVAEACASRFHEQVGGLIAMKWALPKAIAHVIEQHHAVLTPDSSSREATGIAIIQLADAIATGRLEASALASHVAANVLNLYPADIDQLLAKREAVNAQLVGIAA